MTSSNKQTELNNDKSTLPSKKDFVRKKSSIKKSFEARSTFLAVLFDIEKDLPFCGKLYLVEMFIYTVQF